jgi:hypothetical protein
MNRSATFPFMARQNAKAGLQVLTIYQLVVKLAIPAGMDNPLAHAFPGCKMLLVPPVRAGSGFTSEADNDRTGVAPTPETAAHPDC